MARGQIMWTRAFIDKGSRKHVVTQTVGQGDMWTRKQLDKGPCHVGTLGYVDMGTSEIGD